MKQKIWFTVIVLAITAVSSVFIHAQVKPCDEKDYDCRIRALEARIDANPRDVEAYYSLGVVLQKVGGHARAVSMFDRYLSSGVTDKQFLADAYIQRAVSQRKLGYPELAVKDCTKAIEFFPEAAENYVDRGDSYTEVGNYELALADLNKAISLTKDNRHAYFSRGFVYMKQKNNSGAIADFTTCITMDPSEGEAYYNRGTIYYRQKDYAKSITDLTKYIDLNKGNEKYMADGYHNRGLAYLDSGNPSKALTDFTKAIELDPKKKNAYLDRASAYRQLKNITLAEEDERKAAQLEN